MKSVTVTKSEVLFFKFGALLFCGLIWKYLVEATEEASIAYNQVVTCLREYQGSILTLTTLQGNTMIL
ncbi:hypothetical protein QN277_000121 [Acacia crassicarpa]|uniref:Uncharacterized protein n=1 Tax=Acacia crassicarpa TaxID=499986 RepID=A0AAE1N5H1_9FABA|nr:hypothetical protein QN277_000121 [Acacia crassicarpa]